MPPKLNIYDYVLLWEQDLESEITRESQMKTLKVR